MRREENLAAVSSIDECFKDHGYALGWVLPKSRVITFAIKVGRLNQG